MRALSFKTLLFVSFAPCLIGLVAIGGVSAAKSYRAYALLERTESLGALINATADLAALKLPKEGVFSINFSATGNEDIRRELSAARKEVDQALDVFHKTAEAARIENPVILSDIDAIGTRLARIEVLRKSVDARQVSSVDVVGFLQPSSPLAFDLIDRVGLISGSAEVSQLIAGFHALLQYIDGTHMETGAALQAIALGKLAPSDAESFFVGGGIQNVSVPPLLAASPAAISVALSSFIDGPNGGNIAEMRQFVGRLAGGAPTAKAPNAAAWVESLNKRGVVLTGLIVQFEGLVSETIDRLVQDALVSVLTFAIGTALVLFLAGAFGFGTTRFMSRLLNRLSQAMAELARGNLGVTVTAADRSDEIGEMARSIEVFRTAAIDNRRLAGEAEINRLNAEHQRIEILKNADAQAEQRLHLATATLAVGLKKLADGNLTCEIDTELAPQFEALRRDFNTSVRELRGVLQSVGQAASAVHIGCSEISSASNDLSCRTERQAASLEETAAALDEITATVRRTSDGSVHARSVVASAKSGAEQSGTVVDQAIEAMGAIDESSHKVSQIIGVIDEIAFQTSLLALNAGVEAARAGEAGRGFAVVASEVRALAQRSADAAKEIKTLISTSSQQVRTGVDLVRETGEALKRIVTEVAQLNCIVSDIATSTQEQASSLQEVNKAVNQMDQVTQQNAAMVEESTAASKAVAQETEELTRLIGRFQLDTGTASGRTDPSRPKARSANSTVSALKQTGRGGAVRKPESAVQRGSYRSAS